MYTNCTYATMHLEGNPVQLNPTTRQAKGWAKAGGGYDRKLLGFDSGVKLQAKLPAREFYGFGPSRC